MQRLSSPLGFAGRFAGDNSETATIDITVSGGCTFTARVGNGPLIAVSPIRIPLAGPDGRTQDLTIMASGPSGASAVVTITPIVDFPEVDLMLIDDIDPFPRNLYRFSTSAAVHEMSALSARARE